jgi:hypothetical protein
MPITGRPENRCDRTSYTVRSGARSVFHTRWLRRQVCC